MKKKKKKKKKILVKIEDFKVTVTVNTLRDTIRNIYEIQNAIK